jgi:hypothetical protein
MMVKSALPVEGGGHVLPLSHVHIFLQYLRYLLCRRPGGPVPLGACAPEDPAASPRGREGRRRGRPYLLSYRLTRPQHRLVQGRLPPVLTCSATGSPATSIAWYKVGAPCPHLLSNRLTRPQHRLVQGRRPLSSPAQLPAHPPPASPGTR